VGRNSTGALSLYLNGTAPPAGNRFGNGEGVCLGGNIDGADTVLPRMAGTCPLTAEVYDHPARESWAAEARPPPHFVLLFAVDLGRAAYETVCWRQVQRHVRAYWPGLVSPAQTDSSAGC